MTVWLAAPRSDQEAKEKALPLRVWELGAITTFWDPWITVQTQGAVAVFELTPSCRPAGTEVTVRSTVLGFTITDSTSVSPPESVTVSLNSRFEGYSWSGAMSDPLGPMKSCTKC